MTQHILSEPDDREATERTVGIAATGVLVEVIHHGFESETQAIDWAITKLQRMRNEQKTRLMSKLTGEEIGS